MTPAPLAEIAHLLAAGKLAAFRVRWGGAADCHAVAQDLIMDLYEARSAEPWFWYVGRQVICGDHSWIESRGFAIDASNGATRPMLIAPVALYRAALAATAIAVFAKLQNGKLTVASAVAHRVHVRMPKST